MPELPEVETVKRGLATALEGRVLARVLCRTAKLRRPVPPDFAARLSGRRLLRLRRRAKYIIAEFDDGTAMLLHLGMSGRMTISAAAPAQFDKHDHLIFMAEGGPVVCFNDARRPQRLSTPIPCSPLSGRNRWAIISTARFWPLVCAAAGRPSNRFFWTSVWSPALVIFTLPRRCSGPVSRRGARAGRSPVGAPLAWPWPFARSSRRRFAPVAPRSAPMFSRMANWAIFSMPSRSMGGPARLVLTRAVAGRSSAWCKPGARLFSVPIVSARLALHRAIQSAQSSE